MILSFVLLGLLSLASCSKFDIILFILYTEEQFILLRPKTRVAFMSLEQFCPVTKQALLKLS